MRNLYILGASGSIGVQTMDVIKQYKNKFSVVGISFGDRDIDFNVRYIDLFQPEIVCIRKEKNLDFYQKMFPNTKFVFGDAGLLEIASYPKQGTLINALMGSVGLRPTVVAIEHKKDIALANKETLVMAGDIINSLVNKHRVKLLPIDSEHNAILQALQGEDKKDVKKIIITASGGSFRDLTRDDLMHVTKQDALKHPNWSMGDKITIDSATMMNKGLEVIEAHHLFNLSYEKIETILHKESIVHGMVVFQDESVKAILGYPDMRMPILYALSYPNHYKLDLKKLDFTTLKSLTFEPMDLTRYPLLSLAYEVGNLGGLYPVVMNAANEKAVKLFLEEKIQFLDIERLVVNAVHTFKDNILNPSLDEIISCNQRIYESVGI